MVPGVIPGERVRAKVWQNRRTHSVADLVEVLEPSPFRVKPPCPVFGDCGGCQYQFMNIEDQRSWKRGHVEDVLARIGRLDPLPLVNSVVGTDHIYGYRTKLTPHHDRPDPATGEIGAIGFQRKGARGVNLVDVEQCLIATPELNARLRTLRDHVRSARRESAQAARREEEAALSEREASAGRELTDFEKQQLRQRKKGKGATLLLRHHSTVHSSGVAPTTAVPPAVGRSPHSEDEGPKESFGSGGGGSAAIAGTACEDIVSVDPNEEVLEYVHGSNFNLTFKFRAGEFFQNNPFVLPLLVDHVVNEAKRPLTPRRQGSLQQQQKQEEEEEEEEEQQHSEEEEEAGVRPTRLIDAYCGGGLFCLAASAHFERCAGIEISALNIASAAQNARLNGIDNCEFVAGTAEDIFAQVKKPTAAATTAAPTTAKASTTTTTANKQHLKGEEQGETGPVVSGPRSSRGPFDPLSTVVVIDPPRKGCSEEFLQQLLAFAPARVVYVSCDPATQARDCAVLLASSTPKYAVTDCTPFDLFPQTRHIENVMTFERCA